MEEKNIKREYPVKLEIDYPEKSSRLLALIAIPWFILKIILLLPHMIVLYFLNLAVTVAIWLSYWVILFKGRYPKVFFDFAVGVIRWQVRISAWLYSLTDKYPPFRLE